MSLTLEEKICCYDTKLYRFLPFLRWFPLNAGDVKINFLAGLTVALVLIPQSMAYAQLAGLLRLVCVVPAGDSGRNVGLVQPDGYRAGGCRVLADRLFHRKPSARQHYRAYLGLTAVNIIVINT